MSKRLALAVALVVGLAAANALAQAAKAPAGGAKPAPAKNEAGAKPAPASNEAGAKPAPASKEAKPAAAAAPTANGEAPDDDLGHRGQFNARLEFVTGYRMLFRYDKSPQCGDYKPNKSASDQQKFCGFGMQPNLGLAVGFALVDFFEPFAFVRFGLSDEPQTNSAKSVIAGAGFRLYTMSDSRFKIFFSPWLGLDFTDGPKDPNHLGDAQLGITAESYRTDILVHLDVGPHYDFSRGFGIYANGGLTFDMLRYLGANAELVLGVQLRGP
jgi:hypothetical protein